MPDLIVYLPNHGYSNDDPLYVSWLDANYFVSDKDANSFKLATESGGSTLIQFSETITDGFVREVAGVGTSTISGLDHLEGETVKVVYGGEVVGTEVVSSGSVTISSLVFAPYQTGLPFKMKVRTMRLSVPQEGNTFQTRIKRIHETVVRFIKSKLGKAGQEYGGREYLGDIEAVFSTESADTPKDNKLTKGGLSKDAYTVITSEEPVPFTVLATIISAEIEEIR